MRSYPVLTVIIKQTAHRINRIQICRPNDTVTRIKVRAEHTEGTNDREEGEGLQRQGKRGGRLGSREEGWWGGRGETGEKQVEWGGVVVVVVVVVAVVVLIRERRGLSKGGRG